MNNRKRNNGSRPGFNIGSASIIMVFSVLCLTIFAVLSLVTTNSDLKLSRRAAQSIEDFYSAEYAAEATALEINDKLKGEGDPAQLLQSMGVDVDNMGDMTIIRYLQKVDDRRDLQVALVYDAGTLSVYEWKLKANANWNPENGISLWSGN